MFSYFASLIPAEIYLAICIVLLIALVFVNAKRKAANARSDAVIAKYDERLRQETNQLRSQVFTLQARLKGDDPSRVRSIFQENKTLKAEVSKLQLDVSMRNLKISRLLEMSSPSAQQSLTELSEENEQLLAQVRTLQERLKSQGEAPIGDKDFQKQLLKRYYAKIESVEMEYARKYTTFEGVSHLKEVLPDMYAPIFSPQIDPTMAKRILSALSGDIVITGPLACQSKITGSKGEVYQTSLTSCTCEDYRHRGGPCKHMLHLLFTLSLPTVSVAASGDVGQIVQLEQQVSRLKNNYKSKLQEQKSQISSMRDEITSLRSELAEHKDNLQNVLASNLSSIPWLAGMMSDFMTYDLEVKARKLAWGHDQKRAKKVESIRTLRADMMAKFQRGKEAIYQLEYLRKVYPAIDDVLDTNYQDLPFDGKLPEHDPTRDYMSKEEWATLSQEEKDQLALTRYVETKKKTNWQIGRDYELSVSYELRTHGYATDTFGSYMKLEDLGRDIIAKKDGQTLIVQCKYWSRSKTIHEKHIFQLYGTLVSYRIDHNDLLEVVSPVFVTNTKLSDMARKVAETLEVLVVEGHDMVDFPRIKCNIGHGDCGETHIYHLPMDDQYDVVQIKNPGEFYAFTVQEAIDAGFRRAYRWHGSK